MPYRSHFPPIHSPEKQWEKYWGLPSSSKRSVKSPREERRFLLRPRVRRRKRGLGSRQEERVKAPAVETKDFLRRPEGFPKWVEGSSMRPEREIEEKNVEGTGNLEKEKTRDQTSWPKVCSPQR